MSLLVRSAKTLKSIKNPRKPLKRVILGYSVLVLFNVTPHNNTSFLAPKTTFLGSDPSLSPISEMAISAKSGVSRFHGSAKSTLNVGRLILAIFAISGSEAKNPKNGQNEESCFLAFLGVWISGSFFQKFQKHLVFGPFLTPFPGLWVWDVMPRTHIMASGRNRWDGSKVQNTPKYRYLPHAALTDISPNPCFLLCHFMCLLFFVTFLVIFGIRKSVISGFPDFRISPFLGGPFFRPLAQKRPFWTHFGWRSGFGRSKTDPQTRISPIEGLPKLLGCSSPLYGRIWGRLCPNTSKNGNQLLAPGMANCVV